MNTLCMKIDEIEYHSVGRVAKKFDSCQRFLLDRVVAVRQRATFPAVDATTTTALPTRVRMPRTLTARVKRNNSGAERRGDDGNHDEHGHDL